MSPERAGAYRRVMAMVTDLGPSKLHPDEVELIRHSADALVFARDLGEDTVGLGALQEVEQLCRALVDSGRWEPVTGRRLADELYACGPGQMATLRAA